MSNVTYGDAVAEARRLVKRSEEDQWRLAELTWQMTENGVEGQQWARDIGTSTAHVTYLRKVWAINQVNRPEDRPKFADAYAEAKGLPVNREDRRHMEAMSNVRRAEPERQAEVVNELLQNPEVAERVVSNVETREHIARARQVHDTEVHRSAELRHPEVRNARQQHANADTTMVFMDARRATQRAAEYAQARANEESELDSELTAEWLRELDSVDAYSRLARSYLTGQFDADLTTLLGGSDG